MKISLAQNFREFDKSSEYKGDLIISQKNYQPFGREVVFELKKLPKSQRLRKSGVGKLRGKSLNARLRPSKNQRVDVVRTLVGID